MLHFTNIGPADLFRYLAHQLNIGILPLSYFGLRQGRNHKRKQARELVYPCLFQKAINNFA